MSKIPSRPLQIERVQLGAQDVAFFFVAEKIVYSFNFLFDIFWNSIYSTGSRKKYPSENPPPDPKPNPIPNLTLPLPLTPHGETFFRGDFFLTPIRHMYHSLDKTIWFTINFLPLKESLTQFQIWMFHYTFNQSVPVGVIEDRVTKQN